jgi:hypothetical protein
MHENEDDGDARRRFLCRKGGGKRYSDEEINRKRKRSYRREAKRFSSAMVRLST